MAEVERVYTCACTLMQISNNPQQDVGQSNRPSRQARKVGRYTLRAFRRSLPKSVLLPTLPVFVMIKQGSNRIPPFCRRAEYMMCTDYQPRTLSVAFHQTHDTCFQWTFWKGNLHISAVGTFTGATSTTDSVRHPQSDLWRDSYRASKMQGSGNYKSSCPAHGRRRMDDGTVHYYRSG